MVVAGDVSVASVHALAEKWFGPIPPGEEHSRKLPAEPPQEKPRSKTVHADVPVDAIYKTWHMNGRAAQRYYAAHLIYDIISRGTSFRLSHRIVQEQAYLSADNTYATGS